MRRIRLPCSAEKTAGRRMPDYVRVATEPYSDRGVLERLIDAAVTFTLTLPQK
jgi:hypothetical protein